MSFTKAESYVPAIVYATAGANINKHAAVILAPDGLVYPSAGVADERFLGIAMEATVTGAPVLVQTDGIRYGWEGTPNPLIPGAVYYTSLGGTLTETEGVRVGLATSPTTLVFSGGTVSTVSGGGSSIVAGGGAPIYEFIQLVASPLTAEGRIAASWIPLKTPVSDPTDILEIRVVGETTLIPGVDYIITTTPPTPGAGVAPPSTAMPIGSGVGSVVFTAINFDPALLLFTAPAGEESVLPRLRLGDRLVVVRKL